MKLFLASFLEPENFGPGKVIGIALGNKPKHLDCSIKFESLTPKREILQTYYNMVADDPVKAGEYFRTQFNIQLDGFVKEVKEECKKLKKKPQDILPFEEGDTLASWERAKNHNYRGAVADCLEKLGFEIQRN